MKLLIPIDQRGSIAAGYDAPNSSEVIEFPAANIPADIRTVLADCYEPATSRLATVAGVAKMIMPMSEENVIGWLRGYTDAVKALAASAIAEKQARIDAAMNTVRQRRTKAISDSHLVDGMWVHCVSILPAWPDTGMPTELVNNPEFTAWMDELKEINEESLREAALIRKEEKEEEDRQRKKKDEYLNDLVRRHGNESQKERLEAGRLPHEEALEVALASVSPFQTFNEKDKYEWGNKVEKLPANVWEAWKVLHGLAPYGEAVAFRPLFSDEPDDDQPDGWTVEIEFPAGPLRLTQEVRLI